MLAVGVGQVQVPNSERYGLTQYISPRLSVAPYGSPGKDGSRLNSTDSRYPYHTMHAGVHCANTYRDSIACVLVGEPVGGLHAHLFVCRPPTTVLETLTAVGGHEWQHIPAFMVDIGFPALGFHIDRRAWTA